MNSNGWTGRTITLKFKLDTYQGTLLYAGIPDRLLLSNLILMIVFTRAKSLDRWITKKEELFKVCGLVNIFHLSISYFSSLLDRQGTAVARVSVETQTDRPASDKIERFTCCLGHDRWHQTGGFTHPIANTDASLSYEQFFESVGGDQSTSNKRLKTEHDNDQPLDSLKAPDQWDDEMPGFHELDDTDNDMNANEGDLDENVEPLFRSRPPVSEPARSSQDPVRISIKPRSAIARPSSSSSTTKLSQDCPVCGKTLTTDNKGFNDHIDFCLSRGIISQVQAEASVGTSSKPKPKLNGKRRR